VAARYGRPWTQDRQSGEDSRAAREVPPAGWNVELRASRTSLRGARLRLRDRMGGGQRQPRGMPRGLRCRRDLSVNAEEEPEIRYFFRGRDKTGRSGTYRWQWGNFIQL
jgi:hypothetical protein